MSRSAGSFRNLLRALVGIRKDPLGPKRLLFQVIGHIGLVLTVPPLVAWSRKLKRGPIEVYGGLERARIPMIDAVSGEEIDWAIEHVPSHAGRSPARRAPETTASHLVAIGVGDVSRGKREAKAAGLG